MSLRISRSPARQRLLEFLVAVGAVHIVAIALYYVTDVAHATLARQRMFAWIWMGVTIVVIAVGLRRIKRARGGAAER